MLDSADPGTANCPFCGADYTHLRIMWGALSPEKSYYYVSCFDCMGSGPHSPSREVSITKWNTAFAVFLDDHSRTR